MKRIAAVLLVLLLAGFATELASQKPAVRHFKRGTADTAQLPFSDAVLAGNTLYLAGRLGTDPATGRIPDDIEKEVRNLLESMKAALDSAGMTMDDLVTVTVYCPDLTQYDKFNSIYRTYFKKDFPARAFIGSGPLLRGAHFEVQAIAVKP